MSDARGSHGPSPDPAGDDTSTDTLTGVSIDKAAVQAFIQRGNLAAARTLLTPYLDVVQDDREALYLAAVCGRLEGNAPAAERHLRALLVLEPGHGRALQERAHLLRDTGRNSADHAAAAEAYGEAIRANPALIASYEQRLLLLRKLQRSSDAAITEQQLARVRALPKPLLAVTDLLAQGQVLRAEQLCRQFMQQNPRHGEGMRLLADIAVRLGALEEAQFLLETAAELYPSDVAVRIDLIRVLSRRQRFDASLQAADALLETAPDNLQFQSLRAIELLQMGHYAEAVQSFDAILVALPGDTATLTSRGHAQKTWGRSDDAISSYLAAAQTARGGEAWYALANLKTYSFSDLQLAEMLERLASEAQLMERVYLSFALGKAFEDRGEFARSFEHYAQGNRLKRAQLGYRRERFSAEIDAQCEIVSAELFETASGALRGGCPAADPIFIVGMPRAGSTLLEQILATHSQIDGTRELPNILSLAQRLRRQRTGANRSPGYPTILADLDAEALTRLGEDYLAQTRIHRQGAAFFIDKMPNNFRHLALIKLILPRARIIDARREAMACCFSNYKQLFAEGQEFSYDLTDLGHYYRDYERLMAHWERCMPGTVYRLQHESLLDDLESELRHLFTYLEIDFEPACLRFYESDRPVRTPSSEQVRQPIYRDAMHQWQNYADALTPLADALKIDR